MTKAQQSYLEAANKVAKTRADLIQECFALVSLCKPGVRDPGLKEIDASIERISRLSSRAYNTRTEFESSWTPDGQSKKSSKEVPS